MRRQFQRNEQKLVRQRVLLAALSEDLSLPLVHIKSALELIEDENFSKPQVRLQTEAMNTSAETGLKLIEAYHLLLKSDEMLESSFEPLAIGMLMEEIAHNLDPLARQYSTKIVVDVQGRFAPVLAHPASLKAALDILASSLLRAQAAQNERSSYKLVLGAHRWSEGEIAAGVFGDVHGLSDYSLRVARNLAGRARQPLPAVPPGAASAILVADMLCSALWQPLRSAAHNNLAGLATSLPTTTQLRFV